MDNVQIKNPDSPHFNRVMDVSEDTGDGFIGTVDYMDAGVLCQAEFFVPYEDTIRTVTSVSGCIHTIIEELFETGATIQLNWNGIIFNFADGSQEFIHRKLITNQIIEKLLLRAEKTGNK